MRARAGLLLLMAVSVTMTAAPAAQAKAPPRFFGIAPQEGLTPADAERMSRGGIESVRLPVPWSFVQPEPGGPFGWGLIDYQVELAAKSGMEIFPVLYESPNWATGRRTNLPVRNAAQRQAWVAFVEAAVRRYGPGGEFWTEEAPPPVIPQTPPPPDCTPAIPVICSAGTFLRSSHEPAARAPRDIPVVPIRNWQIWDEANFLYFATPASPGLYAKLLKISAPAIRQIDPKARVILSGLFGDPKPRPPKAMPARDFLVRLYRVPGIKPFFDGVALHPYAASANNLRGLVEKIRSVMIKNRDRKTGLYVSELGWGSQENSPVSFEKGVMGQARELRFAYRYMTRNQRRLNIKAVHWFAWKDVDPAPCTYCDSVGLFEAGPGFAPKPAWFEFVKFTGGVRG